jgi:hypothetical protein
MANLKTIDLASLAAVTGGEGAPTWGTGDGRQGYTFSGFGNGNAAPGSGGTAPVDYLRCTPAASDGGAARLDCVDKNGGGWSMPASAGTATGE